MSTCKHGEHIYWYPKFIVTKLCLKRHRRAQPSEKVRIDYTLRYSTHSVHRFNATQLT